MSADNRPPASPAIPLPSATAVIVRDGADKPEVLLVLRHAKTSFGASYVFPGGVLGPEDAGVGDYCRGFDDATASASLDLPSGGIAYYSAGIRELFEEAGVLLARTSDGEWVNAEPLADYREPLNSGRESWIDFLKRHELTLGCDALHYFSFWITPRAVPKRFSTRFFIAELPEGQTATHCGTELTDSRWMTAREAIGANRSGTIELPLPTVVTLTELQECDSATAMVDWARQRERDGVSCVMPAVTVVDGERQVLLPGEPGYPDQKPDHRDGVGI